MNQSIQIPTEQPGAPDVRVILLAGESEIPLNCRGGNYFSPGISVDTEINTLEHGAEVTLRLQREPGSRPVSPGIETGALGLRAQDRFFCEIPGFLQKSGAMPALDAQSESQKSIIFGMLVRPGRHSVLLGIGKLHRNGSDFSLQGDRLRAVLNAEQSPEGMEAFRLFVDSDPDPLELLRRYGAYLARFGRHKESAIPTGWNSWDFYGGAISMDDVEREIRALEQMECRDQLQYLTLDMGWEEAWGDWVPNRRFPGTFEGIAEPILKAGWKPGIWTAPLQVSMFTPLARERQELFLRDDQGSLLILQNDMPCGPAMLLDFGIPEVQEMVGGWFAAMRAAGFELFKIDYLYDQFLSMAGNSSGVKGKTAFARTILETIRRAVGNDAHILNCGGNKEAAIGIADSSRVSMDIHTFWGHIRNSSRQIANCFWMNRNLWINDPDFAVIRSTKNCSARYHNMPYTYQPLTGDSDFWMRGPEASDSELRLWLGVVRLCGGSLFLSDSIRALSMEGRTELGRLFPPLCGTFDPLDLFDRRYPGIWLSRDRNRPTVGLFNWEDARQTLELPPPLKGQLSGRDFWSGEKMTLKGEVELEPRSGFLLEL